MKDFLSTYFKREEFACKCGCGRADVAPLLLGRMDSLRGFLKRPVVITSGYRCEKHNEAVGGKPGSAHVLGLAVDIKAETSGEKFDILHMVFHNALFNRIGVGKDFIHVDMDDTKPTRVVWTY